MPPRKPPAPGTMQNTATSASIRDEDETDDGWIVLRAGNGGAALTAPPIKPAIMSRPPKPPRSNRNPSTSTTAATAASWPGQPFDPAPDALIGRYLPLRRALRCDALPPQIHDADVYGSHPAFLASVYPHADDQRCEWFFFACRARAGPGAYRLAGEATTLLDSSGGDRAGYGYYYRHTFRYHEDDAGASAARETEWRMDEYGDDHDHDGDVDMVVCMPARRGRAPVRVHRAADVFAAHPAVLTGVIPAANDRFEWFFAVRRPRHGHGDRGGGERARRAGPGEYVPAGNDRCVRDGRGRELGCRRVFRYREDDEAARSASRTAW
ncbi:hypothetical protein PR202_ga19733 [Eleusine coracana subsp. coracana]|uniref:NAC domain-containing protein n=1 Tax=Eleusine coracana subsp. coracana TaxID=191504 RepID=A0AAV5CVC1_ELECO|nr:hypothetical protein PR202_ga19733 [Eleusine coracana subsp. coracana]